MSEQPADADVNLVLDFLNTVDMEEDVDTLARESGWREWAKRRGLAAGALDRAVAVRDTLRAAAGDGDSPDAVSLGGGLGVRLDGDTPRLVAEDAVDDVLAAAARLAVLGRWDRVKICPAQDCRWAFYDRSRNHSRTWCSMRVCGNRKKARAFRGRAQLAGSERTTRGV